MGEGEPKNHSSLIVKNAIGKRVSAGKQYPLHEVKLPLWKTETGFRIAVINLNSQAMEITLKALNVPKNSGCKWCDLISKNEINTSQGNNSIKLLVPALDYICVGFIK